MNYNYEKQMTLLDQFIERLSVERNLTKNTLHAYKCDINSLLIWLHKQECVELDQNSILQYFTHLQDELELAPRSIKRKYVSIQQYGHFLNEHYNSNEIFFRFSSRKYQIPRNLPKTLSMNEIKALISTVTDEYHQSNSEYHKRLTIRDMCIIELLFCLGLRIGEVAGLNVDDYRQEDGTLLIRGKGNKERILFISSPIVSQKMRLWLTIRAEMDLQTSALFVSKLNRRLSIYSIENIYYKYRKLAQINPKSTPHYLRHSFATQLLNNGASIRDVQELLGHSSIVTTQIYTEVSMNRKREVLDKYNGRNFIQI